MSLIEQKTIKAAWPDTLNIVSRGAPANGCMAKHFSPTLPACLFGLPLTQIPYGAKDIVISTGLGHSNNDGNNDDDSSTIIPNKTANSSNVIFATLT